MPSFPRMATTGAAFAAALLAVATMHLRDKALAGSPVLTAGTKTPVTAGASTPSWHEHSGNDLVPAYLDRRTETKPKVFKIYPEYFRYVRPRCVAQPRSAPRRGERSGGVRRIAGCQQWTCAQWYAPLNCCVRWECSLRVFR